jgi:uncharacterized protein YndB with AHSA1/START domain
MSHEVSITKAVRATPSAAFHAWTDAPAWSRWFSPNARVDLRVGGSFANDDGDTGKHLAIEPGRLLRFSWDGSFAGSRVELRFAPLAEASCDVMLRHEGLAEAADAARLQKCWSSALDTFAAFVETCRRIFFFL